MFIGKCLLGYSEREVWKMNLKKLFAMYIEYQKENGQYQPPKTLNDIIPF